MKLGHVFIDIWLQNGCVGGSDVCNKVLEGDCVESFCGVIKGGVVYIINGCRKMVACDSGYNEVSVPRILFG